MASSNKIISSLYLPVSRTQLLLPNVSVAEVVAYQEPQPLQASQPGILGLIQWRGINVPLISYEKANEKDTSERSPNARIAVINSIGNDHHKLPFFAILTQGIPRLVKVTPELLKEHSTRPGKADLSVVKIDGEEAVIPNLEYLESIAIQAV